jgi:hypothetical protein
VRWHVKGDGRARSLSATATACAEHRSTSRSCLNSNHHVDNNAKRLAKLVSVSLYHSCGVCHLIVHRPVLPKDFNANQPKTIRLYPLSNYTFGTKDGQPEEDPSVLARLKRLEEHYNEHGMRRTSEAILVCHEHNHPHILMLQIANAFFKLCVSFSRHRDIF